jgi:ABC-type protease/lipase transport system fused ATPase/permease subunit
VASKEVSDLSDPDAIPRAFSAPWVSGGLDLPFTPLFIEIIDMFLSSRGHQALGAASLWCLVTITNQWLSRRPGPED